MHAVETILRELVSIPSVHPGAYSSGTTTGEAAMAAVVGDRLRRLGADVSTSLLAPGRPSVVARFEPLGRPSATIILAPHLDTVGVKDMTVSPFKLLRRGDRLHGRGACDTKGPTAALLWALERWASLDRRRSKVRLIIAATAGEEQGSLGAEQLMESGLTADFAIALEPTRLRIVSAAKGILRVWVTTKGKAAHGSEPGAGVNAIERLLPFAQAVPAEIATALGTNPHPVLGKATINLGVIEGGSGLNVVPASSRMGLDIRTHPHWTEARVLSLLRKTRDKHSPGASLEVARCEASFVTPRTNPIARSLRRAANGWATAPWYSDANMFSSFGIPSVAFGPGSIAQAHTKDEYIDLAQLEAGAHAFLAFLESTSG